VIDWALDEVLRSRGVNCVIDVGGNRGQFARRLRTLGYTGRIVSFEPSPTTLPVISAAAARDPDWTVRPVALSSQPGEAKLRLHEGPELDSLLDARRAPDTFLEIGQARMPVSPAIELLAEAAGARLLFAWPELREDGTWRLRCEQFPDIAVLAAAASRWIEGNPLYWAGWPYLTWRLRRGDMEPGLVAM